MRSHIAIILTAALGISAFASDAFSADTAQQSSMKSCATIWNGMSAADKAKTKYKDYMTTCMKAPAKTVTAAPAMAAPAKPMAAAPAPAMAAPKSSMMAAKPAMATPAGGGSAKCKDGKVVTYKSRSGTCSGHGGVATWM